MTDREHRGWIPASVGCYWTRGGYHISTISQGVRSGYTLTHNRETLASFVSWNEAVAIADALSMACELCGEPAGESGAVCPACEQFIDGIV